MKRQRVSIACQACRKRRIKCDGVKPSCSRCTTLKEPCEYQHLEEKRKPPSKRYIQSLLSRIESLEGQIASYEGRDVSSHDSESIEQQSHDLTNDSAPQDSAPQDSVQELVDLCGGLSLGEGHELRFFDSRSNLGLVSDQLDERCYYHLLKFSADRSPRPEISEVEVDRATQEELLSVFWKWQNSWQYLVHESAWRRSYEARDNYYCTPVLLYAMLAVAARYSDNPNIPQDYGSHTAGITFASKAKQLIFEEIEAPRLSTVIAAALISVAELSLDIEPAGWTYIGIAVRMAYTLGLHTDPRPLVESGRLTAEDAETRCIGWWGCYMIEKFYSIALGRPSACNERDIYTPLPTILPETEFKVPSQLDTPMDYPITNFRYTCEMLRLVTGPLENIYSPDPMSKPEHKIDIALKASVTLSAFYDKVPSVIRLPSVSASPVAVHIYYFHTHYHSLNILLHRPFISRRTAGDTTCQHLAECTRSAETLTTILRDIEKHHSLRTTTISIIHPCLTAGLIHLSNWTLPNPGTKAKAKKHFLQIMHSLRQLSTAWVWALRAIRLLKLVACRWLPDEFAGLMANELAFLSKGTMDQSDAYPCVPDTTGQALWDDLSLCQPGPSWPEGDWFESGMSLFNLDPWSGDFLPPGQGLE